MHIPAATRCPSEQSLAWGSRVITAFCPRWPSQTEDFWSHRRAPGRKPCALSLLYQGITTGSQLSDSLTYCVPAGGRPSCLAEARFQMYRCTGPRGTQSEQAALCNWEFVFVKPRYQVTAQQQSTPHRIAGFLPAGRGKVQAGVLVTAGPE